MNKAECQNLEVELDRLKTLKKVDFDIFKKMDFLVDLKWISYGWLPHFHHNIQMSIRTKDDLFLFLPFKDEEEKFTENIISILNKHLISYYVERGIKKLKEIRFFSYNGSIFAKLKFVTNDNREVEYNMRVSKDATELYEEVLNYMKTIKEQIKENLEEYYEQMKEQLNECENDEKER